MSILIKGMEMPASCCQCPVNMYLCKRGYEYLLEHPTLYDERAKDCPLVPVPPHGDLIDAVEEYPAVDVPAKSKSYLFTYCYENGDHALGIGSVTMTQREFTPINQAVIDDAVEWVRKLIGLPETKKIAPMAFIRFEEGNEDG